MSQLTHYRRALEKDFCDFSRRRVFLSPQGAPPQQQRDQVRQRWRPGRYTCPQVHSPELSGVRMPYSNVVLSTYQRRGIPIEFP